MWHVAIFCYDLEALDSLDVANDVVQEDGTILLDPTIVSVNGFGIDGELHYIPRQFVAGVDSILLNAIGILRRLRTNHVYDSVVACSRNKRDLPNVLQRRVGRVH